MHIYSYRLKNECLFNEMTSFGGQSNYQLDQLTQAVHYLRAVIVRGNMMYLYELRLSTVARVNSPKGPNGCWVWSCFDLLLHWRAIAFM